MKRQLTGFILILVLVLAACGGDTPVRATADGPGNVIFIVPDGCSPTLWAALRAVTVGAEGLLNVDSLPVQGRCRTYSADTVITDSAAAGTAFATGEKTRNGVIGMNAETVRGDSLSGAPLPTIMERAVAAGFAAGIVTTSMVQHATPAAMYSHRAERDWYNLIAGDLPGTGIDVIMGGGAKHMIPRGTADTEGAASVREDDRNIIDELRAEGYRFIDDRAGFDSIDPTATDRLLGLFNGGHMCYEYDRADDIAGEPPLWEMTRLALDILSRNETGFFLLVEAARIDHAAHDHDTVRWLHEGIACDKAVGVAARFAAEHKNTLLVVVPDHGTGGPHFAGVYDTDGGDPVLAEYEEAGFPRYTLDINGFPVDDNGRPAAIQWIESMAHTGEDVSIHAAGPGSEALDGLVENTHVNTVMLEHLGLDTGKR